MRRRAEDAASAPSRPVPAGRRGSPLPAAAASSLHGVAPAMAMPSGSASAVTAQPQQELHLPGLRRGSLLQPSAAAALRVAPRIAAPSAPEAHAHDEDEVDSHERRGDDWLAQFRVSGDLTQEVALQSVSALLAGDAETAAAGQHIDEGDDDDDGEGDDDWWWAGDEGEEGSEGSDADELDEDEAEWRRRAAEAAEEARKLVSALLGRQVDLAEMSSFEDPAKAAAAAHQYQEQQQQPQQRRRRDLKPLAWSLEVVLATPEGTRALRAFCQAELSDESLEFLLAARAWRDLWVTSDQAQRRAGADEIVDEFVRPGAPREVFIRGGAGALLSSATLSRDMFDKAVADARSVLLLDIWPRFEETDAARSLRTALQAQRAAEAAATSGTRQLHANSVRGHASKWATVRGAWCASKFAAAHAAGCGGSSAAAPAASSGAAEAQSREARRLIRRQTTRTKLRQEMERRHPRDPDAGRESRGGANGRASSGAGAATEERATASVTELHPSALRALDRQWKEPEADGAIDSGVGGTVAEEDSWTTKSQASAAHDTLELLHARQQEEYKLRLAVERERRELALARLAAARHARVAAAREVLFRVAFTHASAAATPAAGAFWSDAPHSWRAADGPLTQRGSRESPPSRMRRVVAATPSVVSGAQPLRLSPLSRERTCAILPPVAPVRRRRGNRTAVSGDELALGPGSSEHAAALPQSSNAIEVAWGAVITWWSAMWAGTGTARGAEGPTEGATPAPLHHADSSEPSWTTDLQP